MVPALKEFTSITEDNPTRCVSVKDARLAETWGPIPCKRSQRRQMSHKTPREADVSAEMRREVGHSQALDGGNG